MREMTQRCPSEPGVMVSVAAALGVAEDRPLYVGDLTAGPLGRRLADDNVPAGPWGHPLLVAWGTEDEVISAAAAAGVRRSASARRETQVRRLAYRGYDHLGTLLPGSSFLPVLVDWTEARLTRTDSPRGRLPSMQIPGAPARGRLPRFTQPRHQGNVVGFRRALTHR